MAILESNRLKSILMIPLPLMKNLFFKVILFPLLITCSLYINSLGSTNSVETFVSNDNLKRAELRYVSSFFCAQQTENSAGDSVLDSIPTFHPDLKKRKEPFKAFIYALVPGAIVHGAGHFYAGETSMGFVLLGSEMVGGVIMFSVAISGLGETKYTTAEGFVVAFAGGVLFFGSWIYDMIKSPLIVEKENRLLEKKQNRRLLNQKPVGLEFRMKDANPRLLVIWRF